MRRETRDELLRNFLAINAMLRNELRALRRLARDAETKRNPNWALQPRAPRGTPQGGQWTSSGSNQQAPTRSPTARLPTPRQTPSAQQASLPLRLLTRSSVLGLTLMLTGDTPQPVVASYLVPGTDDLVIEHRFVPQTQAHYATFFRVIAPERRVPVRVFGRQTGIETIEPPRLARLDVRANVEGDEISFDPRALARAYGREIPGVTSGAGPTRRPELVPITPEEQLLVHNMRELGASDAQISVSLQNLRGIPDSEGFIAGMRRNGANQGQVDAGLRELARARRAMRRRGVTLGHNRPPPDTLEDVFPGIASAPPNSIVLPLDGALSAPVTDFTSDTETRNAAQSFIREIRAIDPNYRPPQPEAFPATIDGRRHYIARLRAERADAIYRVRGDIRPLQVETLRFLQEEVDRAYEVGLSEQERLLARLSDREALGTYVDQEIRANGRLFLDRIHVGWINDVQLRIQGREYDSSSPSLSYRVPDVRVGRIAFEVSLVRKTPGRAQIVGFFAADFEPEAVIIVRPTPLGGSYFITRPTRRRRPGR